MVFRITLTRPPFQADFDAGSIGEAVSILENEESALIKAFALMDKITGSEATTETAPDAPKPRGRPKKDPATASAPPPLSTPDTAPALPASAAPPPPTTTTLPPNTLNPPPAPNLTIPADGSIPPFLDRTAPAAAAPPPPPPPVLPSPPTAPVAPPTGVLAPKIVAALETRKAGSPDAGKALADWLAASGLTVPGMSYDEACAAVLFISDAKLEQVAKALGVAA